MKKLIFMIVIALSFIATIAYSQCPPDYTPRKVEILINGCPYDVELCVKCSVLGYLPDCVAVSGFIKKPTSPVCTTDVGLSAQQKLAYIESQVENPDFWNTWLCSPVVPPPPCPSQSDPITILHFYCWKMVGVIYFGEFGIHYQVCNTDAWCEETITWCYDPIANEYQRTTSGPTNVGTKSCSLEGWQVTVPTEEDEESECYIYHTPCNPYQP